MATKQELLELLEAAGVEGFSMANSKEELQEAVDAIDPVVDRKVGI